MKAQHACNHAIDLWQAKKFSELLHFFDREVPQFRDRAWWHEYRANALLGLGRSEEACAAYDDAIALAPQDDGLELFKGEALLDELGRVDEAIVCFDRVLARNPRCADAYFFKGCALIHRRDWQQAVTVLERGVEMCPHDEELVDNLQLAIAELAHARTHTTRDMCATTGEVLWHPIRRR